jgi:hypothetical protein
MKSKMSKKEKLDSGYFTIQKHVTDGSKPTDVMVGKPYKCGHKGKAVILDDNFMSIIAYIEWKDSVGFDGNKEMCWDCWCKKPHSMMLKTNLK